MEKHFFGPPSGQRLTNLHNRVRGPANQRHALLLRDYLRAHPAAASAHAALKRRLARQLPNTARYAEVKDPACNLIVIGAEARAASIGWEPGPSVA